MVNESFYNYLQFEKRFSAHTLTAYRHDLEQFSSFISDQYELNDLSQCSHTFIRSWIVSLMESGMKSKSINRKISTLKSYYKFLQREGIIQSSAMNKIVSPKVPKRLPQFIEEKHMEQLLSNVDFSNDFEGYRNRLIIELFYATGMRISELIGLKSTDVSTTESQLKVLGKRNKERIIPISEYLVEPIQSYLAQRNTLLGRDTEYFFVRKDAKQLYPGLVYRLVTSELAKVSTVERKSPHILRHTFATHMLNHGAELNAIKEILGHSSLAATQVYTHNSIEKLKQIYKQAHPKG
jgi:integrase/recombinase XerC